jgi:membrane protease YdiL (CAAX protease family)
VNDSTSTISPVWPTRWAPYSFKSVWSWLLVLGIAILSLLAFFAGIRTTSVPSVSASDFDLLLIIQFAIEGILVAIVLAALPRISKFSLRELGFRVPDGPVIATALVGALAMVVVANGGAYLINTFAHSQHQQDVVQIFKQIHNSTTTALFVIFAIIFAPFAEETAFRIFAFNFGLRFGGFWAGAVLSGVLFGLAHGDLYAALPLALGAVVLCAVYYRTRNAWASMISHSLFNAVSIVALLAFPKAT